MMIMSLQGRDKADEGGRKEKTENTGGIVRAGRAHNESCNIAILIGYGINIGRVEQLWSRKGLTISPTKHLIGCERYFFTGTLKKCRSDKSKSRMQRGETHSHGIPSQFPA